MTTVNLMTTSAVKTRINYHTSEQVLDALLSKGPYTLEEVKQWGINKDPEAIRRYLDTGSLLYAAKPEEVEEADKELQEGKIGGPFNTLEDLFVDLDSEND
ncbi:MAG: hypothetical protein IJ523_02560 [Succinivibrionaceae bacterium]|nr:hypothetical protein [Succinivibrionaceae bacterium]